MGRLDLRAFRPLLPLLKPYTWTMALSVFLLALEAVADLLQPTLMAQLINHGVLAQNGTALTWWAGWMLAAVAAGAACALGRNALSAAVSQRWGADLRAEGFSRVLRLGWVGTRRWETAALQTRLTFDVNQVQNLLNGLMRLYLKAPLLGLGAVVLAFLTDPLLGLLILPVFPLVALLFSSQLRRTLPLFQKTQERLDELNARVRDFLHGIRIIKGFGRQDEQSRAFAEVNADLAALSTRTQVLQAAFSPAVALTVTFTVVIILAVGGLVRGHPVGHLMAFVQYLTQIAFSLIVVSNLVGVLSRGRASAARLAEVFEARPTPPRPRALSPQGHLVCESVTFGWGAEPIVKGLQFSLAPGERLGVVGATGSGKSTLLHLLLGLIEPHRGAVLGPPGRFGFVAQRPLLFAGSIRHNLLWGQQDASDSELQAVLDTADALNFVRALPEGLDTVLGPGGVNLSGGQRQRLTLARALLGRPSVLLLDEAFSALDQHTETRIEHRLAATLPDTIVVTVAHKVASVRSCSSVLVLDAGRQEGWGSHTSLLSSSEVYRQICRSQGLDS